MVSRWLRPHHDVPAWLEVAARLAEVATNYPATRFAISGPGAVPHVAWTDGPAGETYADAVGDLPGWTWVAGDPGGDIDTGGPTLFVRRDLSDLALAVAVVRFYGSQGRHWSSTEGAKGRDVWRALTEVDDPGVSGYPIPDTMAALLLNEPSESGPGADGGAARADALATRLAAVGYEKLWAIAFAAVP